MDDAGRLVDEVVDLIEPVETAPTTGYALVHLYETCSAVTYARRRGTELLRSRGPLRAVLDAETVRLCGGCRRRWRASWALPNRYG